WIPCLLSRGMAMAQRRCSTIGISYLGMLKLNVREIGSSVSASFSADSGNGAFIFATGDSRVSFIANSAVLGYWGTTADNRGFIAGTDNSQPLGKASRRWSVVFAGTGAINTSDAREKTEPAQIDDAVLDAADSIDLITFKWLQSIQEKGADMARWHFGVIAQQVRDAFSGMGLDGRDYGLLCYDEWDDQYVDVHVNKGEMVTKTRTVKRPVMVTTSHEVFADKILDDGTKVKLAKRETCQTNKLVQVYVINEDGSPRLNDDGTRMFVMEPVLEDVVEEYSEEAEPIFEKVLETPAGNRWGIRPDQCLFLLAAAQRRKMKALEDRIAAVEGR
ncbi:tail fiber domain-containing protein, partial [Aeromonas caviae]|uniref:tail fiber domain-containing protein n=1 Tax=Aeromonas caviae TaxID=648 RepID=UPI00254187DE